MSWTLRDAGSRIADLHRFVSGTLDGEHTMPLYSSAPKAVFWTGMDTLARIDRAERIDSVKRAIAEAERAVRDYAIILIAESFVPRLDYPERHDPQIVIANIARVARLVNRSERRTDQQIHELVTGIREETRRLNETIELAHATGDRATLDRTRERKSRLLNSKVPQAARIAGAVLTPPGSTWGAEEDAGAETARKISQLYRRFSRTAKVHFGENDSGNETSDHYPTTDAGDASTLPSCRSPRRKRPKTAPRASESETSPPASAPSPGGSSATSSAAAAKPRARSKRKPRD